MRMMAFRKERLLKMPLILVEQEHVMLSLVEVI
jgi:hypothetical protein